MGAGISVSSNVAQAVADAYTSVLNSTNISFDQDVGQTETIGFNNCDVFVGGNANISQSQQLTASLEMTANVTDTTNIANDVAQVLAQSASSSVGEMAIGYAAANNVASTYASMNTNVANYVTQTASVITDNDQSFQCSNSTITVNGDFSLGQSQSSNVSDSMSTTVNNTSEVTNTISQSIEQTASASTGMDMWSFLIFGIVLIVGVVIMKILVSRNRNQALGDDSTQKCIMEMAKSKGRSTDSLQAAQASCPECVDSCIGVDTNNHMYIHWGWFIFWIIMLSGIGITIGVWYGLVASKGCINSESCGATSASSWASGCSCDMDNSLFTTDGTCSAPVTETVQGLGAPIKYQYPLLYSMTSALTGTSSNAVGAASLQGMMITSFKSGQDNYNSNNGNNLYTLINYDKLWYDSGNSGTVIKNLFLAAVKFIDQRQNTSSGFTNLYQAMYAGGYTDSDTTKAQRLFQYLNPLRLEFADSSATYMEPVSSGSMTLPGDVSGSTVYPVPPQFRYNTVDTTSLGSCSITTMTYTNNGVPFSVTYDGTDASYCSNHSLMDYPSAYADNDEYILGLVNTSGNQDSVTNFSVDDLTSYLKSQLNDITGQYVFQDTVSSSDGGPNIYTALDVYCRFANLESENAYDYGMMRLLYSGILSTQTNMGKNNTLWGLNTLLQIPNYTTNDFAYTGGQIYDENQSTGDGSVFSTIPSSLFIMTVSNGVSEGSYETSSGFMMTSVGSDTPLSGQAFTATGKAIGYCQDYFFNESTLTVLWVLFGFWFILFPASILIRYYIGETKSMANKNTAGSKNNATIAAQNGGYYFNPNTKNPFKACSKTGTGKSYPTLKSCQSANNIQ